MTKGFWTVLIFDEGQWKLYQHHAWSPTTTIIENLENLQVFVNGFMAQSGKKMKIVRVNIDENYSCH